MKSFPVFGPRQLSSRRAITYYPQGICSVRDSGIINKSSLTREH